MKKLLDNEVLAPRLNQRSIEFYNSAECLRRHFALAVHVIDYCTALSFELKLKAILALRNKFTKEQAIHNIEKLFKDCKVEISDVKQSELISYYNIILNRTGRYSISKHGDRESIDSKISNLFYEVKDYFVTPCKKSAFIVNNESGIMNECYKEVWNTLCEVYDSENIIS